MKWFTDFDVDMQSGPVEQSDYVDTLDALDAAKEYLNKSSRSLLNCFSSAESSNQQFLQARSELAKLATVYMDVHFPFLVMVVRDLRNVCYLYMDYDVKKFTKNIHAMEKSVTEQATSSAVLSRIHGLLLSELERLHIDMGKKLESIKAEAVVRRDDYQLLLEAANVETKKFFVKEERCNAEKERYDGDREFYDAERARYLAERERYRADEAKYYAKAQAMSRQRADVKSEVAMGWIGLTVVAGAVGVFIVASGDVRKLGLLVLGHILATTCIPLAIYGIYDWIISRGSEKEAKSKKETAKEYEERATQMSENAKAQGEKAIANVERAATNAERAAASAEKASREGKREANQAIHDARECDKAVELIKNDMINSLTLFIKAMEKVSQFLKKLSSDIDSCVDQVSAAISGRSGMERMKEHLNLIKIYQARIIKSCDSFESFQVVIQARVNVLPDLNGTSTAVATSEAWCGKHVASGKLQEHDSLGILVRLFPAHFPSVTNNPAIWHKSVLKSAVRFFKHCGWH